MPEKKMNKGEMEAAKRKVVRREGKSEAEYEAEVKATRIVQPGERSWPPEPTDGEDDEA